MTNDVVKVQGKPRKDYSGMVYENMVSYLPDHPNSTAVHKLEVMEAFMASGDTLTVAKQFNMDFNTLATWTKTQWWTKGMDLLLAHQANSLRPSWVRLQQIALRKLSEAVEFGEEVVTKEGGIIRKNLSAKDLMAISAGAQEQNNALKILEEKEHDANKQSVDVLTEMAKAFANAAKSSITPTETHRVIDITDLNN